MLFERESYGVTLSLGNDLLKQPFVAKLRLMAQSLDRFLSVTVRLASDWLSGPHFALKTAIGTMLLSLVMTFPIYQGMARRFQGVTGQALSWKVLHPLSPVPSNLKKTSLYSGDVAGEASHADKLELRVTLPIVGWLSKTGAWTVVVWNHVAGFGTFYLLAALAFEALLDSIGAALFVLALGPTFFGAWFFNDFLIGDGIAFFLLLLSIWSRWPVLTGLSLIAAAFSDERCIFAVPLLLCYVAVRFQDRPALRNRCVIAVCVAVSVCAVLRWWMALHFGLSTGRTGLLSADILRYQLTVSLPWSFTDVFKGLWTLPAFALLSLSAREHWRSAAVLTASFGAAILSAFLVWDFERSVAYSFVVLLIALYALRDDHRASRKYLAAILVLNISLSAPGKSILRAIAWFV